MKRIDLNRHIEAHGCRLLRDAGKHTVYFNPANNRTSAVPPAPGTQRLPGKEDMQGPGNTGAVTTGGSWKFAPLQGGEVTLDLVEYHIESLGKILGVLG